MSGKRTRNNTSVIVYEPIRRCDLQDMVGCTIRRVSIDSGNRSILFVVEDKNREKAGYGFCISEFLDDVIIQRGTVKEVE